MSQVRIERVVSETELQDEAGVDFLSEIYRLLARAPRVLVLALEESSRLAGEAVRCLRLAQAEAALQGVLVVIRTTNPASDELLRSHGLRGVYGVVRS